MKSLCHSERRSSASKGAKARPQVIWITDIKHIFSNPKKTAGVQSDRGFMRLLPKDVRYCTIWRHATSLLLCFAIFRRSLFYVLYPYFWCKSQTQSINGLWVYLVFQMLTKCVPVMKIVHLCEIDDNSFLQFDKTNKQFSEIWRKNVLKNSAHLRFNDAGLHWYCQTRRAMLLAINWQVTCITTPHLPSLFNLRQKPRGRFQRSRPMWAIYIFSTNREWSMQKSVLRATAK